MKTTEMIRYQIQKLSEPIQKEVLDFVEFLIEKKDSKTDEVVWSDFSLTSAMRDMEEEPTYDDSDLKERWK
ncbi:MAG: DUF2281 domain-containing protein [Calditrichaeota bacterium]|nr:DUF2281 domain-containing protein [Calditrichota bacterium]